MRSRVQVSLPLPTKNQALASTQVLFFYPFSGFTTKFPPPSAAHCSGIGSLRSTDPLAKNSKKIAKNQPYASARHLCGSLWREPLKGASLDPLREFLEEPLLGASAGVVGGASARRLPESFWGTPGGAFGEPLRAPWGGCSKPMLGTFWRAFGAPLREPLEGAPLGPLRAPLQEFLEEPLLEAFWRAFGAPLEELLGSLCGHLCGRNKKPVLEGRVPHTNINNTNNAMAEFSAFCFRYKGRTKRIMGQSPQLSIFVRVNSPDLGSKPPRYR